VAVVLGVAATVVGGGGLVVGGVPGVAGMVEAAAVGGGGLVVVVVPGVAAKMEALDVGSNEAVAVVAAMVEAVAVSSSGFVVGVAAGMVQAAVDGDDVAATVEAAAVGVGGFEDGGDPSVRQPPCPGDRVRFATAAVCFVPCHVGHLVGWSWSQLPIEKKLEVRVTEWESQKFSKIAEKIYVLDNCELAPHDMALTDDALIFKVNSLSMDPAAYMSGMKGPAAALSMDGRAPVTVHILPRPCAENSFEPFSVEVPACFSIHFSHAYKDKVSGNIVTHFSGWPPNDSKDFLGKFLSFYPRCNTTTVSHKIGDYARCT
jgi:hypothetical protein